MSITKAKFKDGEYSCIASSFYLLASPHYHSQSMLERLNIFYGKNKLNVIIVHNGKEKFETIAVGDDLKSYYSFSLMNTTEFFEKLFIAALFLDENMNKTIFIFSNIKYRSIVENLALLQVRIYGGSGSKKHTLSPVQLRLARFIIAVSNHNNSDVADSFYFEKNKNKLNLTNIEDNSVINQYTENIKKDIIRDSQIPIEKTNSVVLKNNSAILISNPKLSGPVSPVRRGLQSSSVFLKSGNTTDRK